MYYIILPRRRMPNTHRSTKLSMKLVKVTDSIRRVNGLPQIRLTPLLTQFGCGVFGGANLLSCDYVIETKRLPNHDSFEFMRHVFRLFSGCARFLFARLTYVRTFERVFVVRNGRQTVYRQRGLVGTGFLAASTCAYECRQRRRRTTAKCAQLTICFGDRTKHPRTHKFHWLCVCTSIGNRPRFSSSGNTL